GMNMIQRGGNELFPIFLKLNELQIVLVGAGNTALEKLTALLQHCPDATIRIVAREYIPELIPFIRDYPNVSLQQKNFEPADIRDVDLVLSATGNAVLNEQVRMLCRERRILVNVADKPALCDFYFGSVVKKNDLKIAI